MCHGPSKILVEDAGVGTALVQELRNTRFSFVPISARVLGVGIETADMLVNEVLSRRLRDGKAIARCRPHRLAGRERQTPTREGLGACWQCARSLRHDPVGNRLGGPC
jgi:hypothetical protein